MYCGYITKINNLRKHTNADRLMCTEVFGNNVIVDLSYKINDIVVYFPVDGQLGEEFAKENNLLRIKNSDGTYSGGYLDAEKRNIKAIKLRGEKSDGLVLPIKSLEKYTDVTKLKSGDQITVLNGKLICQKYIPVKLSVAVNNDKSKKKRKMYKKINTYDTFHEHKDTAQLAYNKNAFKNGDLCYITLKMHGTSGRTSNALKTTKKQGLIRKLLNRPKIIKKWECVSGSRRVVLEDFKGGFYCSNTFRKQYHDLFKDKLPKGFTVFYEIVGYVDGTENTIMGKCNNKKTNDKEFIKKYGDETVFSYGCEIGKSDVYVYRMTFTNEDDITVEIPWEIVKLYCEKWGVKHCPELDKFFYTNEEDLMNRVEKHCDGEDPVGKTHIREGVVIRIDNKETFTAFKHKNFNFKLLEGIVKDTALAPDMEEEQEVI